MKKSKFDLLTITEKADLVRKRAEEVKKENIEIDNLDAFNIAKKELTIEY